MKTSANITGVFDLDTGRLIGLAPSGTSDVTYVAGQDTATPSGAMPVTATTDPVTGGIKVSAPGGAMTAFPAHHIMQLKSALSAKRIFDSAVMSSPPIFTESGDFASGSISSGVFIPLDSPKIHKPTPISVAYATQGRNVFGPAAGVYSGLFFGFSTDAQVIEIDLQTGAASCPIGLVVDGQFASASLYTGTPPGGGNIRRQWKFDFGSRKMRNIQVLNAGVYNGIAGIFVGPSDQVVPYDAGVNGGFLEIADSYGGQLVAPVPHGGPGMGILDALNYCGSVAQYGGSGYYTTNGANNYLTRLQAWIAANGSAPSILLTMGGINDDAVAANTKAAIDAYVSYCATNLKSTLHIFTGPWCPKQSFINGSDKYSVINGWIKSALQASSLTYWVFLDTINGGFVTSWGTSSAGSAPWITGSGYAGGTTGTGNADNYISSDQTHPSAAGIDYFRRRVSADVLKALQSFW